MAYCGLAGLPACPACLQSSSPNPFVRSLCPEFPPNLQLRIAARSGSWIMAA